MAADAVFPRVFKATPELFKQLYGAGDDVFAKQMRRYEALKQEHRRLFGQADTLFFSSPGRTEIGGNHTDHNNGRVLAAAVTLDMLACVSKTDDGIITLYSKGYEKPFVINTAQLALVPEEAGTSLALIRGVCFKLRELGQALGGFNAVMTSDVLSGSGLSSSAAFEVLVGAILLGLYGDGRLSAVELAKLCQFAENVYFGKPSGLMDQCACAVGSLVGIDFKDGASPIVRSVDYDFAKSGYCLVVVATRSSHDDLTAEYASIPAEMKQVAKQFQAETLRAVDEDKFFSRLPELREKVSDRALLRSLHFFNENRRVNQQLCALETGDLAAFLQLVNESGLSSWTLLQNLYVGGQTSQSLALACALSRELLSPEGAWRVHGGGFAGTILAFVPNARLKNYVSAMDALFGSGACTVLGIRPLGPVAAKL